jgi:hypothetical protein
MDDTIYTGIVEIDDFTMEVEYFFSYRYSNILISKWIVISWIILRLSDLPDSDGRTRARIGSTLKVRSNPVHPRPTGLEGL